METRRNPAFVAHPGTAVRWVRARAGIAAVAAVAATALGAIACATVSCAPRTRPNEGGAPRPAQGTLFLHTERIPLAAGGLTAADRGTIFVPTNRKRASSGVISLDVYRFKATHSQSGVPPIFLLYGGPSFGGLEPLLNQKGYYESRIQPLQEVADVVVVSQRGIGPSKPTTLILSPPPFPLDQVTTEAERAERIRQNAARERAFWLERGLDLEGFTVVEAAADVNDVRKALGYDRITLWGGSFGSHWAMAIMRFYPEIVARAILRGMEGPDHTYDMPSHVLNSLRRIAAEAEKAPSLAAQIPPGGLLAAFQTVIERVSKEPVTVSVMNEKTGSTEQVRFGPDEVRAMALGYTARASTRAGMRTWPSDILALYRGDFSGAAQARLRERESERFRTASYYMLDCGSGISLERRAQFEADKAVALLGRLNLDYDSACPVWGSDLGETFRRNFDTQIPTLIVNGDYDVSTPLENALELAPHFKQGKLTIVHGGSHPALDDAMDASPEFSQAVLAFARSGDMSRVPAEVQLGPIDWVVPRPLKR